MSKERDILKSLLLKEELEVLDQLKQKLLSEEQFTQEVSDVLATAIKRANKKDADLTKALEKPIKKGVIKAFTESKQTIIDALMPIMGQLVRQTVANSIKQFVTDINRKIEEGYSLKAIKWRWQAKKAGIEYAEMLFQKTIRYQVNELFLISRENGLLVEHVGSEALLKDNNAISAMLTVIQDFIRDSFNEDGANLQSIAISNRAYIIVSGPQTYLAAIVKGAPTARLEQKLQELIENIHAEFSTELANENNYRNIPDLKEYLAQHLITKNKIEEAKPINLMPWVFATLLLLTALGYMGYKGYLRSQEYDRLFDISNNIDGFYLHSIQDISKGYKIKGLLDPLADISILENKTIELNTKPFISIEPSIIKQRISNTIKEYQGINSVFENGTVYLSGLLQKKEIKEIEQKVSYLAGVNQVINHIEEDNKAEIEALLQRYNTKINSFSYSFQDKILVLSGSAKYQTYRELKKIVLKIDEALIVNDDKIIIVDSNQKLISQINKTVINFPKLNMGTDKPKLLKVYKSLQTILQRKGKIKLTVIGESDCNGVSSDSSSQNRAEKIKKLLIQNNIHGSIIESTIKSCKESKNYRNDDMLNVSFNVRQEKI